MVAKLALLTAAAPTFTPPRLLFAELIAISPNGETPKPDRAIFHVGSRIESLTIRSVSLAAPTRLGSKRMVIVRVLRAGLRLSGSIGGMISGSALEFSIEKPRLPWARRM